MTESQIKEYQELIRVKLNHIGKNINQIEPGGGNKALLNLIKAYVKEIKNTLDIMIRDEHYKGDKKNK